MANLQRIKGWGNRGAKGLNDGSGLPNLNFANLFILTLRSNNTTHQRARMSSPVLDPSLDHCLGCIHSRSGKAESMNSRKNHESAICPIPGGLGNLGFEHLKKDSVCACLTKESVNNSEEVKNSMKEMESQIRMIRGENYELKRAMTHMYTLMQVTKFELRNRSTKIDEKVESLAEVMEKGCPCYAILEAKITSVHYCARIVEDKIDNTRADIRKLRLDLLNDAGGPDGGNAGMQA